MATQKNFKSKVTASKSKSSKTTSARKPVSKSKPSKAKPAPVKAKASVKTQAAKGKKSTPVSKTKPSVKAAKPAAKKATGNNTGTSKKPAPVAKTKAAPQKSTKPKAKVVTAPRPSTNGNARTVVPGKKSPASIPVKTSKPQPVTSTAQSKPALKPTGSKVTDVAAKPLSSKPKEVFKPKETVFKPNKPITLHTGKSFEKMSDKKETRPVTATALPEEPQKTRYNDKELEEFDQLIDQKLIVAREQLEFYLKQLEDMAENPDNKIKGLDDGLSSLESERISSMAARQQKLIQHLENAKIRIKNKVYGICRETGKLISKERLRAVPHATLSIEAKQAQN